LLDLVLPIVVLGVGGYWLVQQSLSQRFTIDESRWISTSRYFWVTFVDGDLFGSDWEPNYITLTHPPLARYVLGFGLAVQGWRPDQLNDRYDSRRSREFNELAGTVPGPELLRAARNVQVVIAVACLGALYVMGRLVGGPWVGASAALLAAANPLLSTLWTRALAESLLSLLTLVAVTLAVVANDRREAERPFASWMLAAGAVAGLTLATKLSGVLVGGAIAVAAGIATIVGRRPPKFLERSASLVDVVAPMLLVFWAVNPLLWVDPARRTAAVFEHRRAEMEVQRRTWPVQSTPNDVTERAALVARRTFTEHVPFRRWGAWPVNAFLITVGVVALAARGVAALRDGRVGSDVLLLCWAGITYFAVIVSLGFDSTHYYAPLVLINAVFGAMGLAGLGWFARIVRQKTHNPSA
jgi:4-amino-4-deoxy-L-arabinose transferase-like glycosyltransferase